MTYIQFLVYVVLTACSVGIVFLVGFMMVMFASPAILAWFDAKEAKENGVQ